MSFLLLLLPLSSPSPTFPLNSQISSFSSPLLSPSSTFLLSFLPLPSDPTSFLLSISPSTPAQVPVWTAGSLLLLDPSLSPLPLWRSPTDHRHVTHAALTDAGNLPLISLDGHVIWDSFSPTDSLLPSQPLRHPHSLRPDPTNSISSYYSLSITPSGHLILTWEHNVTYWTASSARIQQAMLDSDGKFALFDFSSSVSWVRLSKDYKDPNVQFR